MSDLSSFQQNLRAAAALETVLRKVAPKHYTIHAASPVPDRDEICCYISAPNPNWTGERLMSYITFSPLLWDSASDRRTIETAIFDAIKHLQAAEEASVAQGDEIE